MRARQLGIAPGVLPPGPLNAITDVAGVLVGHATVVAGDSIRTGVTAILPHGGNLFQDKVPGAVFVLNGYGKSRAQTRCDELGEIETPIVLTNTLERGAGRAERSSTGPWRSPATRRSAPVNAVVGETNDGTSTTSAVVP